MRTIVCIGMVAATVAGCKRSTWDLSVQDTCGRFEGQPVAVDTHVGVSVDELIAWYREATAVGRTVDGDSVGVRVTFEPAGDAMQTDITADEAPGWCSSHYPRLEVSGAWTVAVDGVLTATWSDPLAIGPDVSYTGALAGPQEESEFTMFVAEPTVEDPVYAGGEVVPWLSVDLEREQEVTNTRGYAEWAVFSADGTGSGEAGEIAAWGEAPGAQ